MTQNRDVVVAIFLLAVCGVLWYASFDIRVPDYGQLSPTTWPRIILGALTVLSLLYLVQSVRTTTSSQPADSDTGDNELATSASEFTLSSMYQYWKNVIWCFVLFGLYLYSLPWLGMLLGALSFVFLLLCVLGGWTTRKLLLHALIAAITVGGMWSLFTYGLGVILPSGSLFDSL